MCCVISDVYLLSNKQSCRFWLESVQERDALLAEQIHVFNSFFYAKLNVPEYVIWFIALRIVLVNILLILLNLVV